MKKFYRYELYLDGKYQGIGIFHGLGELNLRAEVENALLDPFNMDLYIPPACDHCEFLFTEEGKKRFEADLCPIFQAYEDDGLFDINVLIIDASQVEKEAIAYEDDYQVAVLKTVLEKFR